MKINMQIYTPSGFRFEKSFCEIFKAAQKSGAFLSLEFVQSLLHNIQYVRRFPVVHSNPLPAAPPVTHEQEIFYADKVLVTLWKNLIEENSFFQDNGSNPDINFMIGFDVHYVGRLPPPYPNPVYQPPCVQGNKNKTSVNILPLGLE